jgi:hypothetical protein
VSAYSIGQFFGSIFAIAILCLLLRLLFKRFLQGNMLIVVTVFSAVALATFLTAFGSADGGPPDFGSGFARHGFGGVVVLVIWLFRAQAKAGRNG